MTPNDGTPISHLARTGLTLVGFCFLSACASPPKLVHVVEIGLEKIHYSYDPARIAPDMFKKLLRLSPYGMDLMPPSLELCIADDPDYRECGTRTLGTEHFCSNADVNISKGKEILDFLDRVTVPPVLTPVLEFRRRETSFSLCLETARLAYYRGNGRALQTTCNTTDAMTTCPDALREAPLA